MFYAKKTYTHLPKEEKYKKEKNQRNKIKCAKKDYAQKCLRNDATITLGTEAKIISYQKQK